MKNKKRYFFEVPSHVAMVEAAALYNFMALGETTKTEYLDKRHQYIFSNLENLMEQVGTGCVGTQELCAYLSEQNLLNAAGGLAYVQKIFNCLEPMEVVC
jgi:hypothetical protein